MAICYAGRYRRCFDAKPSFFCSASEVVVLTRDLCVFDGCCHRIRAVSQFDDRAIRNAGRNDPNRVGDLGLVVMKTALILLEMFMFGLLNGLALVAGQPAAARLPIFFAWPVDAIGYDDFLQTGGATYTAGLTCGLWTGAVL